MYITICMISTLEKIVASAKVYQADEFATSPVDAGSA